MRFFDVSGTCIVVDDWLNRLLIDSPKLRHEVAEELEARLDIPEAIRPQTLADLASTDDFLRRIEKGESLRARSLPYFYSQLAATIRARPHLNIRDLLPKDHSALLQFLRLSAPVESGFAGALASATEEMVTTLPLAETLDRLFRLPVELPEKVVRKVRDLTLTEKKELIRVLLSRANSPLWRFQFLRLADRCFSDEALFVSIWNVLPSDGSLELKAYLTLVRWTFDELMMRVTHERWSAEAILATSWVHGDHLFCIFQAYGWDMSGLIENFSMTPSRRNAVFRDWEPIDGDVANPHNVTADALLVGGLRRVSGQGEGTCLYPGLLDRFRSLISTEATMEGSAFPAVDLIQDVTGAPNQLSSFLSYDRLSAFRSLGGDATGLVPTLREKLQCDALTLLKHDHKDGWLILKVAFGNEPIPEAHVDEIRAAVGRMDVDGNQDPTEVCTRLFVAGTFLKFVANEDVKQHFKEQLVRMSGELGRYSNPEHLGINTGYLLEAALNLARCEATANARVAAFATLTAELALAWPGLGKKVLPMVQEMCDDLPLEQTGELWKLNLRLRSH